MAVKTSYTDKDKLFQAPLPNHAATYAVITHKEIVINAMSELQTAGFNITEEIYKSNINGEVAYGIYNLDHSMDPDIQMMFAWGNTYDKTRKFRCAVGANVKVSNNAMINGDLASYARKHTGNANQEAHEHIVEQVKSAVEHYNQLIIDKNLFLNTTLTARQQSEILGIVLHEKEIINLTQVALIQKELKKATFDYSKYDADSAFVLYNHINHSLKDSHPAKWMDNHQDLHRFFINEFGKIIQRVAPTTDILQDVRQSIAIQELIEPIPIKTVEVENKVQQNRRTVVFM
jgi:hypothetical protein